MTKSKTKIKTTSRVINKDNDPINPKIPLSDDPSCTLKLTRWLFKSPCFWLSALLLASSSMAYINHFKAEKYAQLLRTAETVGFSVLCKYCSQAPAFDLLIEENESTQEPKIIEKSVLNKPE